MNVSSVRAFAFATTVALSLLGGACDGGETTNQPVDLGNFPVSTVKSCANADIDMQATFAQYDITYITFGAKWCTACREEPPIINKDVLPNVDGARVKVIQMLLENNPGQAPGADLCQAWTDDLKPNFEVMSDIDQSVVAGYYNGLVPSTLPEHILVDRTGKIVYRLVGAIPDNMDVIINDWLP